MLLSSESFEQTGKSMASANINSAPLPLQQSRNFSQGPVAILWDIENCSVPSDVSPEDVAGNIRMALRVHPVIRGAVTMFSAYGDFNAFTRRLREGCQRTGVKLIDVPNGRKDAADKAILIDMFLFALDNPPPSSIMLISGDVDFAPALHILGQRGYTVILVIPSGVGVSSALCNAGSFVSDWPSVARGEGFLPPAKAFTQSRGNPKDVAAILLGCHVNDNADGQNKEGTTVYRGISQKFCDTRDFSQSLTEYNSSSVSIPSCPMTSGSHSLPSVRNEVSVGNRVPCDRNDLNWEQPGDLNGLKGRLVQLLQLSGGCMLLTRVSKEHHKVYGMPLCFSEYGAVDLVNLLEKMADSLGIRVEGKKRYVYLNQQNEEGGTTVYRGISQKFCDTRDFSIVSQSLTEYNSSSLSIPSCPMTSGSHSLPSVINEVSGGNLVPCERNDLNWVQPGDFNGLKARLVQLLQLSGGCMRVTRVPKEHQKVYGRPLCVSEYGAVDLVNLLEKMADSLGTRVKGEKSYVYLRNSRGGQSCPSSVLLKKERKKERMRKGAQEENTEIMAGTGSSEDCSDEERVVIGSLTASIPSCPMTSRSHSLPSVINEVSGGNFTPCDRNDLNWLQPGDLNGLKGRLVKLLQLSGGCLLLTRVPEEHQKVYGRPLCVSEYGAINLVNLLEKMADSLGIRVNGEKRHVYLRNSRGGQSCPSSSLSKKERKKERMRKGAQEENTEIMAGTGSSEDCSDEERVVVGSLTEYNSSSVSIPSCPMTSGSHSLPPVINEVSGGKLVPCDRNDLNWVQPGDLTGLKGRLVKLLQLSGGCMRLTRIPEEHQKVYGRPLCVSDYGAVNLVNLLEKMADSLGIRVKGEKRHVYLRNSRGGQTCPPSVLLKKERKKERKKEIKKERKGKGAQEDNIEIMAGTGSSEDCSDEERVVIEQN